jgi:leader peptidase (prepilin peptidase)/N-methyltransferase
MNSWELVAVYHPWVFDLAVILIGLCVGSFLNVCIYRMPRGLSIVWPGSFCPKSREPLKWWENIPLVSFIILRGRGRVSHEPIGWQYPLGEAFTALLFWVIWHSFAPAVAVCYMIMAAMMFAGAAIDWQFKIIPDSLTLGGVLVALIASAVVPALHGVAGSGLAASLISLGIALKGMLFSSAVVLWIALIGEVVFKREAMGFGDVKLMGFIGAMLGTGAGVFAIFGGAVIGMVVAIVMLIAERLAGKNTSLRGREIPFGPMLCTAAFLYLWLRPALAAHFATMLGGAHV